jgi:hypothetical protein
MPRPFVYPAKRSGDYSRCRVFVRTGTRRELA